MNRTFSSLLPDGYQDKFGAGLWFTCLLPQKAPFNFEQFQYDITVCRKIIITPKHLMLKNNKIEIFFYICLQGS